MKQIQLPLLLICLLFSGYGFSQVYNRNYSLTPVYKDKATVKSSVETTNGSIITVGSIAELSISTNPTTAKNDAIVTKTDSLGNHVWSVRYGVYNIDEQAHAVELTYDKNHVIVVGQAQIPTISSSIPTVYRTNVLAFKINIATGNIVWSKTYGVTTGDEVGLMIKKLSFSNSSTVRFPGLYTIVGTSRPRTGLDQSIKMYAVSIFDNGNVYWTKRYGGGLGTSLIHTHPFTMTYTKTNNLMIAGTRYEINRPSEVYTVGINPLNGSITDKFVRYRVDKFGYVMGGAICRLKESYLGGYALAFTTSGGASSSSSYSGRKITVMKLNSTRKPLWTKYYWQPGNSINDGIAIYEHVGATDPIYNNIDVFVGVSTSSVSKPGYMNLKPNDGSVNYFLRYNKFDQYASKHIANDAIKLKSGYALKSLFKGSLVQNKGFTIAKMATSGKTHCYTKEAMKELKVKTDVSTEAYYPVTHGIAFSKTLSKSGILVSVNSCYQFIPANKKETTNVEDVSLKNTNKVKAFPNPIEDNSALQVQYSSVTDGVLELKVYNALGAEVLLKKVEVTTGMNQIVLNTEQLTSGLNVLIISHDGEVISTQRIIKK